MSHPAIFYRGCGLEMFKAHVSDPPPRHYRVIHKKAIDWTKAPGENSVIECAEEVYTLNDKWTCPLCNCVVYNNHESAKLPGWVFEQEATPEIKDSFDRAFREQAPWDPKEQVTLR
jgi:hypothetical protein